MDNDTPAARLAELFNVNHVILSQANPYLLPFMSRKMTPQQHGFTQKLSALLSLEIRHRMYQVISSENRAFFATNCLSRIENDLMQIVSV
jgi:hypothetical protein